MKKIEYAHPIKKEQSLFMIEDESGNRGVLVKDISISDFMHENLYIAEGVTTYDYLIFYADEYSEDEITSNRFEGTMELDCLGLVLGGFESRLEPERYSMRYLLFRALGEGKLAGGIIQATFNANPGKKFLIINGTHSLTPDQLREATDSYEYSVIIGHVNEEP